MPSPSNKNGLDETRVNNSVMIVMILSIIALLLSLILLLHVIGCNKSRPDRRGGGNTAEESGELSRVAQPRRPSGSLEDSVVRQRYKSQSSESREKKSVQRAPVPTAKRGKQRSLTPDPAFRKRVSVKIPSWRAPKSRRKNSYRMPNTIEADFEPGAYDQHDLLAAAEEMAQDAGAYENMDPNEEPFMELKTARHKRN